MNSTRDPSANGRRVATEALEHVCSGSGAMRAADCYGPTFVLRIAVQEQVVDQV